MIEMKNVAAGYGKNQVLHGVNLRAKQGKITTLIGSNGSGKSTLLHTMLKVIPLIYSLSSSSKISSFVFSAGDTETYISNIFFASLLCQSSNVQFDN